MFIPFSPTAHTLRGVGETDYRVAAALALPCALGVELVGPRRSGGGRVGSLAATPAGTLHAAALAAVLELGGFLAVLPTLEVGEHAVTHAFSTQYLRAGGAGDRVQVVGRAQVVGRLNKRARSLAFASVTAHTASGPREAGFRLLATNLITKSIIAV